jgi:hypothetical protein
MGVWEGVAMDSLKFHLGLPCPTLVRPAGWPPLKRPYRHFKGGPPTGWTACDCLPPPWTPHAVRLWTFRTVRPHGSSVAPNSSTFQKNCVSPGPLTLSTLWANTPSCSSTMGSRSLFGQLARGSLSQDGCRYKFSMNS